jgi:hypothetical protein
MFLPISVFSGEIWNGFTTEMTRENAANKVKTVYGIDSPAVTSEKLYKDQEYKENIDGFSCPNPDSFDTYIIETSSIRSIRLMFKNNQLYIISVEWKLNFQDAYNRAVKEYGNPSNQVEFGYIFVGTSYQWKQKERYLIIEKSGGLFSNYYISREIVDDWRLQVAEQQKEAEQEAQRKREQAESEVIF